MIAALYIDPRGPYPSLIGPEHCWDESRDARLYAGPLPVVAHPPCGPWGCLRHLCTKQSRELAPLAVEQVRRWGGVLEHPRGSKLWEACNLPLPGAPPDTYGGWTLQVSQCNWGHPARKWTWLYIVGPQRMLVIPPPREPTHWISGGRGRVGKKAKTTPVPLGIKICSAQQRRRTPVAFARFLLDLAEGCR